MADEKNTDCFLLLVIKYLRNNQNLPIFPPLKETIHATVRKTSFFFALFGGKITGNNYGNILTDFLDAISEWLL